MILKKCILADFIRTNVYFLINLVIKILTSRFHEVSLGKLKGKWKKEINWKISETLLLD